MSCPTDSCRSGARCRACMEAESSWDIIYLNNDDFLASFDVDRDPGDETEAA